MALEWCKPCRDRGRLSVARHEVAGTHMCDGCFGGKPSSGVRKELAAGILEAKREKTKMPKRTSEETRTAILKDAAAGMTVEQIRVKHGVGWPTAKRIIDDGGIATRPARRGRAAKAAAKSSNGSSVTMRVTQEMVDAFWAALALEKKAALLNLLSQV